MTLRKMIFAALMIFATSATVFGQANNKKATKWVNQKVVERIHKTNADLNLTDEQFNTLVTEKTADFEKVKEIKNSDKSDQEKNAALKEVYGGTYKLMKKVLTPEQFEAWKAGK
ncbi:hypothetical protein AXE80_10555 [Wenyingzhuangia fucanilytica]|uniref:DUF4890 domain-containing protein n=1 Tax=Wenyingzhuangia fucanilytica TaxID=1790137 RepID=A0A1B1Y7H5_9FLAO|nr:hypothetical protein [Wenyingzhuangia fucanilytica]ANW96684.1 hypothetical protein AXE80_10555 [Wenyingzhuangia fucanilytica]